MDHLQAIKTHLGRLQENCVFFTKYVTRKKGNDGCRLVRIDKGAGVGISMLAAIKSNRESADGRASLNGELFEQGVVSLEKCSTAVRFEGLYGVVLDCPGVINISGFCLPSDDLLKALIDGRILQKRQLISTDELAALIRMKPQTIAKWRSAGIADPPPAIHLGRQVRYDAEEVMDWIYRNRL